MGAKAKVLFEGAPRFNEFVVQTKGDAEAIRARLLEKHNIIGGLPLKQVSTRSWARPFVVRHRADIEGCDGLRG